MDMIPTEIVFMCYGSHKCRLGHPYVPRFSVASVRPSPTSSMIRFYISLFVARLFVSTSISATLITKTLDQFLRTKSKLIVDKNLNQNINISNRCSDSHH